ncbi:MAG: ChbG/HpnK family deacetylase [Anaerolineae bacterium]|nr:ChbG/HpnK family deacetylase [Anaerolineae bacterium]
MAIKLIITADDCGLSQGIDHAAGSLFDKGMVSTASIMMNYPHVGHSFDYFGRLPNLETGIHLNLTEGEPLSEIAQKSDLVRSSGRFRNKLFLYAQALFLSTKMQNAIEVEFRSQIERFIALAGQTPTHITTHMHFHVFPAIRDIIYHLAEEYDVQWVRNHDFRSSLVPMHPLLDTRSKIAETPHNFFIPDYLTVVKAYLEFPHSFMQHDILKLEGIVEIVVHPSAPEDIHFPHDASYSPAARHREVVYLEKVFDLLAPQMGHEIEVINISGVLNQAI